MTLADWQDPNAAAVAVYLDGPDDPDRAADGKPLVDDDFLILVNAWWEPLDFVLPPTREEAAWHLEVDTYDPPAQGSSGSAARRAGDHITASPRSVAVLTNRRLET